MTDHDCQCSDCEKEREADRNQFRLEVLEGLERQALAYLSIASTPETVGMMRAAAAVLRAQADVFKRQWGMP